MELDTTSTSTPSSSTPEPDATSDWVDLYALLDVPQDADEALIRKRISARYSEAVANSNHRDGKRREYYQLLGQQFIPQCRRVLLNAAFRASYDEQRALHQSGAAALPYRTFLSSLNEGASAGAATVEVAPAAIINTLESAAVAQPADTVAIAAEAPPEAEAPPKAEAPPAAEAAPASAAAAPPEPITAEAKPTLSEATLPTTAEATEVEEDDAAPMPIIAGDRPLLRAVAQPEPDSQSAPAMQAGSRNGAKTPTAPPPNAQPRNVNQDRVAPRVVKAPLEAKARAPRSGHVSRVVVGDTAKTAPAGTGLFRPGERVLSNTSVELLTAIVATMLITTVETGSMPGVLTLSLAALVMLHQPRLRQFVQA